jgi:hypothetical protein
MNRDQGHARRAHYCVDCSAQRCIGWLRGWRIVEQFAERIERFKRFERIKRFGRLKLVQQFFVEWRGAHADVDCPDPVHCFIDCGWNAAAVGRWYLQ